MSSQGLGGELLRKFPCFTAFLHTTGFSVGIKPHCGKTAGILMSPAISWLSPPKKIDEKVMSPD
jgi:hypothetical protein